MIGGLVNPVFNESTRNFARSRVSLVFSSGVKDADLVAPRSHLHELQTEKKSLLSRRVENQKTRTGTLLKLCYEKKKRSALESQLQRLTQQLMDVPAA